MSPDLHHHTPAAAADAAGHDTIHPPAGEHPVVVVATALGVLVVAAIAVLIGMA